MLNKKLCNDSLPKVKDGWAFTRRALRVKLLFLRHGAIGSGLKILWEALFILLILNFKKGLWSLRIVNIRLPKIYPKNSRYQMSGMSLTKVQGRMYMYWQLQMNPLTSKTNPWGI